MIELKPCPLCGGEVKLDWADFDCDDIYYEINCPHCDLYMYRGEVDSYWIEGCDMIGDEDEWRFNAIKRELAENWNRRV